MTDDDKEQNPLVDRDDGALGKTAVSRSSGGATDIPGRDGDKREAKNPSGAIPDEIWEHEQERLNPGQVEGNPTGASRDKPKAPSNSA